MKRCAATAPEERATIRKEGPQLRSCSARLIAQFAYLKSCVEARNGNLYAIYDAAPDLLAHGFPGHPLAEPKPLAPEDAQAEAQTNFDQWFKQWPMH